MAIAVKARSAAAGDARVLASVVRDVSARTRDELELGASERRFRIIFDSAADALLIHDVEGRTLEANRAACDGLGYTRDELLALLPLDLEAEAVPAAGRGGSRPSIAGRTAPAFPWR